MSMDGRASLGGAIYENGLVKQGGVWKFRKVHAYNTFSAAYDGGWARAAGRGMPGPSANFPPDAPPSALVSMLPVVYEIPYHYANPVSGRRELPPLPAMAQQLAQFPPVVAAAAAPVVPDSERLVAGRKAADKPLVSLRLPNHSHLSEAYAVGTADQSLTGTLLKFIEAPPK
jgi:hypothetical protein